MKVGGFFRTHPLLTNYDHACVHTKTPLFEEKKTEETYPYTDSLLKWTKSANCSSLQFKGSVWSFLRDKKASPF
jgi:hypothetical protein